MGSIFDNFDPTGIANTAAGAVLGIALEGHNDRRQLEQQQKLQDMQIAGQKQMGQFNYEQQMKMWNETNYAAQIAQMNKAGLNPALLYGQGGGGGTTAAQSGTVSGGQAPQGGREITMGIEQAMNISLLKAQRDNINADTKVKEATVPKLGAETANIGQNTDNLWQANENQKWSYEILKIDKALKNLELYKGEQTNQAAIDTIKKNLQIISNNAEISQATKDEIIKGVELDIVGKGLQNSLTNSNIKKTDTEIGAITQRLINETRGLNQKDTELKIRQQLADWDTNITREVVNDVIKVVGIAAGLRTGGGMTSSTYENTTTDSEGNRTTREGSTSTRRH